MAAAALMHRRRARGRVLVVDDDEDIRESLTEALEREGYDVTAAADGDEALSQLLSSSVPPDLIVLDLVMPKRSGEELLQVLRKSVTFVDVPVVVLSAFLGSPPAGAIAWLRKPCKPPELLKVIERHIE
jgi:DNA-binding response OmpR family regulator